MTLPLSEDDIGQCGCGSAWFYLVQLEDLEDDDVDAPPGVWNITGYAGRLVCIECDEDWNPHVRFSPRGHLRVVQ